jgi:hypothetical protein
MELLFKKCFVFLFRFLVVGAKPVTGGLAPAMQSSTASPRRLLSAISRNQTTLFVGVKIECFNNQYS